jgi:tRNA(His) 5'-end guanylyltransferase
MSRVDDVLGDEIKAHEKLNSDRAANIGDPVVIRVDGASFSKFTRNASKPFDERISAAMVHATKSTVDEFNCRLGYTQSDEISFLLYSSDQELPLSGRYEKLASRFAAHVTAHFLKKGLELFPELIGERLPSFDGRAMSFPTLDLAAKAILWRELDARRNAVSMAARSVFSPNELSGRSSWEQRKMMSARGLEFDDFPETFRRGAFVRRVKVVRELTVEELSRIPEKHRPNGPVERSSIEQVTMPNLSLVDNLADVLVFNADPIVAERKFALAVTG